MNWWVVVCCGRCFVVGCFGGASRAEYLHNAEGRIKLFRKQERAQAAADKLNRKVPP